MPFQAPLDQFSDGVSTPSSPDLWATISRNGTTPKFRIVHLQRLANPLLPWDATRNPYRTVDSMVIDLTAFNGVEPGSIPGDTSEGPLALPLPIPPGTLNARERGENNGIANGPTNNPWTQEDYTTTSLKKANGHGTIDPNVPFTPLPASSPLKNQVFQDPLDHSLGYLNWFLNQGTDSSGKSLQAQGPRDNSNSSYGSLYGWSAGSPFRGSPGITGRSSMKWNCSWFPRWGRRNYWRTPTDTAMPNAQRLSIPEGLRRVLNDAQSLYEPKRLLPSPYEFVPPNARVPALPTTAAPPFCTDSWTSSTCRRGS